MQLGGIYQTCYILLRIPLLGINPIDILTYAQGEICINQFQQHCSQQQQTRNTTNVINKETVLNKLLYIHILNVQPFFKNNTVTNF